MTTTVIVGAGAAGLTCAKALRELDEHRTIIVVDKDPDVPYERPPLSKALIDAGTVSAGTQELTEAGIQVTLAEAQGIDTVAHTLQTSAGDIAYDDLVLAPGSRPHRPEWASKGIHALHSLEDSRRLRAAVADADSAVVIGGGFVGAELAASLVGARVRTTLVFRESALFENRLGRSASDLLAQIHADAGVHLLGGRAVEAIPPGTPARVVLTDGTHIEADLVVAGIGSHPDTAWLQNSGLLAEDGTIYTDATLTTGVPSVKAAGDSARWIGSDGHTVRSAHWTSARSQGRHIAHDLVRRTATPFTEAPYFWSMQHGSLVQGIGLVNPPHADLDVTPGNGPKPGLLVRYNLDGTTVGGVAINNPQGFMAARAEVESLATTALAR